MPAPYMSGPHPLEGATGPESCFEIKAPHRGSVTAIKFSQLSGDPVDCSFEVYTSELACPVPAGSSSSSGSSESAAPPAPSVSGSSASSAAGSPIREAYSLFGGRAVPAGTNFFEGDKVFTYRNQDGTYSVPVNKLYVAVRPAGLGPYTFCLTLEIETSPLQ